MISKIALNNKVVDAIVFWTKDSTNFMKFLPTIDKIGYKYYFQYTINFYDKTIEPNLRNKNEIIQNFIELSKKIGKEKVIWRYDPILISNEINVDWHIQKFSELCDKLANYTNTVVISFFDEYKKLDKSKFRTLSKEEMLKLGESFSRIAKKHNLAIRTCAEEIVFTNGIEKGACIDKVLIEKICGYSLNVKKDKTQRAECGCVQSIDIGEYNTCSHFCKYCYANNNCKNIKSNIHKHNPNSPLLIGELTSNDKLYERDVKSLKK